VNAGRFKAIVVISLVLGVAQAVWAGSVHDLVHHGNKLYDEGHFNEALKEYDQALIDQPQTLEPKFNKANCYFQIDDLARAIDLYNEVAADSKDMKLVARAKYNLGNSYFRQGSKQKDSNLQKALEDLKTSIVCWRSALEISPENEKAAKNIEVARLIIKDIIDQLNKQKQQQKQQAAKQKQLQEQLKQLLEQQKALARQSEETENQLNQGQLSRQQAADSYTNQAKEQLQLKTKTEQTSQQIQRHDPNTPQPPQMQRAAGELKKAVDHQADAEKQLKASNGATAKQSQDKAVENLENALNALSQKNPQNQQQKQQQGPNQPQQKSQQQKRQNQKKAAAPDITAQQILNKEREQRKKRQSRILQRSRYQKVEKDW